MAPRINNGGTVLPIRITVIMITILIGGPLHLILRAIKITNNVIIKVQRDGVIAMIILSQEVVGRIQGDVAIQIIILIINRINNAGETTNINKNLTNSLKTSTITNR